MRFVCASAYRNGVFSGQGCGSTYDVVVRDSWVGSIGGVVSYSVLLRHMEDMTLVDEPHPVLADVDDERRRTVLDKDLLIMVRSTTMRPVTEAQLIAAAAARGFVVLDCPKVVRAAYKDADAVVMYADRDDARWVAVRTSRDGVVRYVLGLLKGTVQRKDLPRDTPPQDG